jgi:glycogen debranching enzyme
MDIKTLLDLQDNLPQDIVKSNSAGAVGATTVVFCNTKSWHGLLSVYNPETKEQKILLSNVDDAVIVSGKTYYLSTRKYPNVYFPLGHQYISEMSFNPYTHIVYDTGGIRICFEAVLATDEETLLCRYSLLEAFENVKLQVRPLVAFRDAMKLLRLDRNIMTGVTPVHNGVSYRPRRSEPELYMQTSKPCEFISAPDWNYNIEYSQDRLDGKPYQEDLFMPGFFETELKEGEDIIFVFSTKNHNPELLGKFFAMEGERRQPRRTYKDYLNFSAMQMFREVDGESQVLEKIPCRDYFSYHLFGALPGLTLSSGKTELFMKVIKSYLRKMKNFAFGSVEKGNYDVQSPLWMVWAVQQYTYYTGQQDEVRELFCELLTSLAEAGMEGTISGLYTSPEGLMSTVKNGIKRYYADINALWYNALMFVAELNTYAIEAESSGFAKNDFEINQKREYVNRLTQYAKKVSLSFKTRFLDKRIPYLADSVNDDGDKDLTCRPGQLMAFALPYPVSDEETAKKAVPVIEEKLLTPLGLRSCPKDSPSYRQNGDGDIYPIYLGFLAEYYLRYFGEIEGVKKADEFYNLFNSKERIDTESPNFYEKFDPEPPYRGKGSPLFAGTVATLNRIKLLIDQF